MCTRGGCGGETALQRAHGRGGVLRFARAKWSDAKWMREVRAWMSGRSRGESMERRQSMADRCCKWKLEASKGAAGRECVVPSKGRGRAHGGATRVQGRPRCTENARAKQSGW
eukprot:5819441-Pleurochrysis_carterae.AAC.1